MSSLSSKIKRKSRSKTRSKSSERRILESQVNDPYALDPTVRSDGERHCEDKESEEATKQKWEDRRLPIWNEIYKSKPIYIIEGHGNTVSARDVIPTTDKINTNTQLISPVRSSYLLIGEKQSGGLKYITDTFKSAMFPDNKDYYLFEDDGVTRNLRYSPFKFRAGDRYGYYVICQKLYRSEDNYIDVSCHFEDTNNALEFVDINHSPLAAGRPDIDYDKMESIAKRRLKSKGNSLTGIYIFNNSIKDLQYLQDKIQLLEDNIICHEDIFIYEKIYKIHNKRSGPKLISSNINSVIHSSRDPKSYFIKLEIRKGSMPISSIMKILGEGTYYLNTCKATNDIFRMDKDGLHKSNITEIRKLYRQISATREIPEHIAHQSRMNIYHPEFYIKSYIYILTTINKIINNSFKDMINGLGRVEQIIDKLRLSKLRRRSFREYKQNQIHEKILEALSLLGDFYKTQYNNHNIVFSIIYILIYNDGTDKMNKKFINLINKIESIKTLISENLEYSTTDSKDKRRYIKSSVLSRSLLISNITIDIYNLIHKNTDVRTAWDGQKEEITKRYLGEGKALGTKISIIKHLYNKIEDIYKKDNSFKLSFKGYSQQVLEEFFKKNDESKSVSILAATRKKKKHNRKHGRKHYKVTRKNKKKGTHRRRTYRKKKS